MREGQPDLDPLKGRPWPIVAKNLVQRSEQLSFPPTYRNPPEGPGASPRPKHSPALTLTRITRKALKVKDMCPFEHVLCGPTQDPCLFGAR